MKILSAIAICIAFLFPYTVFPCGAFFPSGHEYRGEAFHGSPVRVWAYDIDGDGKPDYRKEDVNNDGVIDLYLYDRDFDGMFDAEIRKSGIPEQQQRHLIICADSVSRFFMEKLWEEGHFRDFYPPSCMISTFPSDTNPAFTEIFDTAKMPGVEDRYYDREKNRIVGGAWDHLKRRNRKTDRSFHAVFDYEQNPRYGALIYLAPCAVADHDIARCRRVFWKLYRDKDPDEPIFLYIGSMDAIGHKKGAEGMRRQLLKLEEFFNEIIYKTEGGVSISLYADHGNNMVYSDRMIDLGRHLAACGFRLRNKLTDERDVVAPRFGLVGNVCIHTRKENSELLAEALKTLEGVDFAIYEKDGDCIVTGARGRAKIIKSGKRYRYEILEGDPLELGAILKKLSEQDKLDKEGFADDEAWFEATKGHRYPDILRRLSIAATDLVINRPTMLLSLKDGYCYGNGSFIKMIDLVSTHGSALDTSTNAIAMSTSRRLPDYIRTVDLMKAFGEPKPGIPPLEEEGIELSTVPSEAPEAQIAKSTPAATPTPRYPMPIAATATPGRGDQTSDTESPSAEGQDPTEPLESR
jgi:hypothetical protein